MEREVAEHVAKVAFRSASDLGGLVPILKEHCNDEDYKSLSMAIAFITGRIGSEVLKKIYSDYPDIKIDIDEKIKKYGRLI